MYPPPARSVTPSPSDTRAVPNPTVSIEEALESIRRRVAGRDEIRAIEHRPARAAEFYFFQTARYRFKRIELLTYTKKNIPKTYTKTIEPM